ncbi:MAG: glycosyl hydrolase family 2 [Muribaculaceae bacterium]|nr:glycosyl hydrolase family 2 [Muribaculaceae bacterium]
MKRIITFVVLIIALASCDAVAGNLDELWQRFVNPQMPERTKLWWFHGETETTREGITADLTAFRDAGIGGVVFYDQVHGPGTGADDAFSPRWWEMFIFAAEEAKRLGLSFETHLSNGYVGGGPWITPELSMQMLIAESIDAARGTRFDNTLPLPARANGYYFDVATVAFPKRHGFQGGLSIPGVFTVSPVSTPAEHLIPIVEDSLMTARSISYTVTSLLKTTTRCTNLPGHPSATFVGTGHRELAPIGTLEASDDGIHYYTVTSLKPAYSPNTTFKTTTVSFPAVTARYFRINISELDRDFTVKKPLKLSEIYLSTAAMESQWAQRAGLISEHDYGDDTPDYKPEEVINSAEIIDLSSKVDSTGRLRWDVPAGNDWTIMRFVSVPTGSRTRHGRANLLGLECDKMSAEATILQWNSYFKVMRDSLANHNITLSKLTMDSHEGGAQNWTRNFEHDFERLRGYSLVERLPVMAGYIVNSTAETRGTLHDVRRTIADLISSRHYATLDSLCRDAGVEFTAQAVGNGLCIVADPIQAKGRVSIPEGEFWAHHPDGNYDIKECSSAAHLYNKPIASGEAFTDARFDQPLSYLKTLADGAWHLGINEFVVCASAYQPRLDIVPGNTGGGRHYCLNRNNTYWTESRDFWDYQARGNMLMRQGKAVNDLCIYLGENAPVKILTYKLPQLPDGLVFDAFTTDALMNRMSAGNGRILLPDSTSYAMMVLQRDSEITLAALRKIRELVAGGARLYGNRPVGSPSALDIDSMAVWNEIVNEMWGETPVNQYGKGVVFSNMTLEKAVELAGILPDVSADGLKVNSLNIRISHRRTANEDIYMVNNHTATRAHSRFTFNTPHPTAEIWDPVRLTRRKVNVDGESWKRSIMLDLQADETLFIIFTSAPSCAEQQVSGKESIVPINSHWNLNFPGHDTIELDSLVDWSTLSHPNLKYFSGTATYRTSFTLNAIADNVVLRLPGVKDIARIRVNGRDCGNVWCAPWEVDVTNAVTSGLNHLEIDVTNSLMNRMILDSTLPIHERQTVAIPPIATPATTPAPSGLTAPIFLILKSSTLNKKQ